MDVVWPDSFRYPNYKYDIRDRLKARCKILKDMNIAEGNRLLKHSPPINYAHGLSVCLNALTDILLLDTQDITKDD